MDACPSCQPSLRPSWLPAITRRLQANSARSALPRSATTESPHRLKRKSETKPEMIPMERSMRADHRAAKPTRHLPFERPSPTHARAASVHLGAEVVRFWGTAGGHRPVPAAVEPLLASPPLSIT